MSVCKKIVRRSPGAKALRSGAPYAALKRRSSTVVQTASRARIGDLGESVLIHGAGGGRGGLAAGGALDNQNRAEDHADADGLQGLDHFSQCYGGDQDGEDWLEATGDDGFGRFQMLESGEIEGERNQDRHHGEHDQKHPRG